MPVLTPYPPHDGEGAFDVTEFPEMGTVSEMSMALSPLGSILSVTPAKIGRACVAVFLLLDKPLEVFDWAVAGPDQAGAVGVNGDTKAMSSFPPIDLSPLPMRKAEVLRLVIDLSLDSRNPRAGAKESHTPDKVRNALKEVAATVAAYGVKYHFRGVYSPYRDETRRQEQASRQFVAENGAALMSLAARIARGQG
jgi:hypothetical protein